MSLVGNLEDLGLGDILQIVSLSRKSGVLSLTSRQREGKVLFRDGQVVRASSSGFREHLGSLLVRLKIVDVGTLRQALEYQKTLPDPPMIGVILAESFGLSQQDIEAAVKDQVERIVYSFFSWDEGSFSFELGDPKELTQTAVDPLEFMLQQGLNPQWLAMEGSRIIDEKKHRGDALEDVGEEPVIDVEKLLDISPDERTVSLAPATPAKAPPDKGGAVLIVDDDQLTAEGLQACLADKGFAVESFTDGKAFLTRLEEAKVRGERPSLVIDLIMPRLDGSGILGGLELLEQVRSLYPGLTALVMSDHPNEEAERHVQRHGVPVVVPKPKKNRVKEEGGCLLLTSLGDTLAELLTEASRAVSDVRSSAIDLGAELLREMGEDAVRGVDSVPGSSSPGLFLLKGMLQELNNPALGGGIILLVLRFASELMNRAVIFFVRGNRIIGLGQFGLEFDGEVADARVRRMAIPADEQSIFSKVLEEKIALRVHPGSDPCDRYLCEQLGSDSSGEVFLGPLLSEGKVVAILYGDNHPHHEPIGDTEALEIFLSQAGLAMEKALLERRLRGKYSA